MKNKRKDSFVPYEMVPPGFEAMYTGEKVSRSVKTAELPEGDFADESGNIYSKWPLWTWTGVPFDWGDEVEQINCMQEELGPLDDEARRIRAHIGSLAHCDSSFPVTVDELLDAIGRGKLDDTPLHNGCYSAVTGRTSQPGQDASMRAIESILKGYLSGEQEEATAERFPQAKDFISRVYEWLGSVGELTKTQRLMMERMLLPFEYLTKRNPDPEAVCKNFFEGGRGVEIDAEISEIERLPTVYPNFKREFRDNLDSITDPKKKETYKTCGALAHGLHELSDCHHSTFRWIERWIHGIGTGEWDMPTRKAATERKRLGRLMFGYVLGLDKWLVGKPMQFLLLDLGHIDLGFDPKNEILRVYAYLGEEETPTKEWLVACLWYHLYNTLLRWNIHQDLIERGGKAGISLRECMDSELRRRK